MSLPTTGPYALKPTFDSSYPLQLLSFHTSSICFDSQPLQSYFLPFSHNFPHHLIGINLKPEAFDIPLGRLGFESPPGFQMEIGRGITARVVVQDDAIAGDEVAELKDLSGQFGIAASMLGTRINKAIEAAEKRKAELKKATAALGASEKARITSEKKSSAALTEVDRMKRAMAESAKLDVELQKKVSALKEEARLSAEEVASLKEKLATAEKAAEEAGPAVVDAYKLSDEFFAYQEASFDQGFNHLARCLWAYHGRESITFEEMLQWIDLSQRTPELLALHPDIPYTADHIAAIQNNQIQRGDPMWDPPPVNPVNFSILRAPPAASDQPGDEYIDTPGSV